VIEKKSYRHLVLLLGFVLFACVGLRTTIFTPGVIAYSFEWYIPPLPSQMATALHASLRPWVPQNFGLANVYPAAMYINALLMLLSPLGGGVAERVILVAGISIAGYFFTRFAQALGVNRPAAILCGGAYCGSPFVLNHTAAGHLPYLMAFDVTAVLLCAILAVYQDGIRSKWIWTLLLLPLASQLQAPIAIFALFVLLRLTVLRRRSVTLFIILGVSVFITANLFWMLPLVAQAASELKYLSQNFGTNQQLHVLSGGRPIVQALRLEPYSNPITFSYVAALGIFGKFVAFVSYGVPLVALGGLLSIRDERSDIKRRIFLLFFLVWMVTLFLMKGPVGFGGGFEEWLYEHFVVLSFYKETYHFGFFIAVCLPLLFGFSLDQWTKSNTSRRCRYALLGAGTAVVLSWTAPFWLSGNLMNWAEPVEVSHENDPIANLRPSQKFRLLVAPNAGLFIPGDDRKHSGTGIDPYLVFSPVPTFGNWLSLNPLGVALDESIDGVGNVDDTRAWMRYASIAKVIIRTHPQSMFQRDSQANVSSALEPLMRAGDLRYAKMTALEIFDVWEAPFELQLPVRRDLWSANGRPATVIGSDEMSAAAVVRNGSVLAVNAPRRGTFGVEIFSFEYLSNRPGHMTVIDPLRQRMVLSTPLSPSLTWRHMAIRFNDEKQNLVLWFDNSPYRESLFAVRKPRFFGLGPRRREAVRYGSHGFQPEVSSASWVVEEPDEKMATKNPDRTPDVANWPRATFGDHEGAPTFDWYRPLPGKMMVLSHPLAMAYGTTRVYASADPLEALSVLERLGRPPSAVLWPEDVRSSMRELYVGSVLDRGDWLSTKLIGCTSCVVEPGLLANLAFEPSFGWVSGNISSNWIGYYNDYPGPLAEHFLYTSSDRPLRLQIPNISKGQRVAVRFKAWPNSALRARFSGGRWHEITTESPELEWIDFGHVPSTTLEIGGFGKRLIDRIVVIPPKARGQSVPNSEPDDIRYAASDERGVGLPAGAAINSCSSPESIDEFHTDRAEQIETDSPNWSTTGAVSVKNGLIQVVGNGDAYKTIPWLVPGASYRFSWRYEVHGAAIIETSLQIPGNGPDGSHAIVQRVSNREVSGWLAVRFSEHHPNATLLIRVISPPSRAVVVHIHSLMLSPEWLKEPCELIWAYGAHPLHGTPQVVIRDADYGTYDLETNSAGTFMLVLNENFDELWQLRDAHGRLINAPHFKVNGYANGWILPGGPTTLVTASYGDPLWWRFGEYSSVVGIIVIIGGIALAGKAENVG